ncbi:hypothetical protein T08_12192 [Trichinella sp. T8]|nr:hypothetical protein T08_12192 [Trichinella sp. T8]
MADVPELHLVPNRCGIWSNSVVWTNLDVTSVIKQNDHIESCPVGEHLAYKMKKKALLKKRSAEETKPIPAIYDEEASAASAEPSTSGHFPLFKRDNEDNAGEDFLLWECASKHILIFSTADKIRLLAAMKTWAMDGTFKVVPQWYQQLFTIHAFVAALLNKVAVIGVNLNPQTIICDFETALIPAIQGYFPNTRVQGCYFHFCQAVHRKVGELGLKARYRTEEETRKKIIMFLAIAYLY